MRGARMDAEPKGAGRRSMVDEERQMIDAFWSGFDCELQIFRMI